MLNDSNAQNNHHYLTIGQVSEAVSSITGQHCTSAMIYNYERLGLLNMPARSPGGFRLFCKEDVYRVVRIKRLQDEGLLLAEILERLESASAEDLPAPDWPDQPVDRRTQILETAMRVFPQRGFSKTTLQDIANEVGISGPAIYQYFKSKEALFLSLYEGPAYRYIFEELTSLLQKKEDATLEDIRQILMDLGEAFLFILSSQAESLRMIIGEARQYPHIGQSYVKNQIAPVEARVKEFFDYYVTCGLLDIPDTLLAANAFFGMFLNLVLDQNLLFAQDYPKRPTVQAISPVVDIFLKGIKKE